jgi:hypothetical protein
MNPSVTFFFRPLVQVRESLLYACSQAFVAGRIVRPVACHIGRDCPAPLPKRKITILSQEQFEDDAAQDLRRCTTGLLGQRLKEKAALNSFEPNLGKAGRDKVVLPHMSTKAGGRGGSGAGRMLRIRSRRQTSVFSSGVSFALFSFRK